MTNIVQLHKKPSLDALRKAGTQILDAFKEDPARRRSLLNEVVRVAYDEPSPPERNSEIRALIILLARSFDRRCAMAS